MTGEEAQATPGARETPRKKTSPIKRFGCGILLVCWFAFLLAPCGLFYLAANGEIRLEHGDAPMPHRHPRLLISLIGEESDRGLRIETAALMMAGDQRDAVCVETDVRFLLWESSGGNMDARFCDCYRRDAADDAWQLASTAAGHCRA